MDLKAYIREIPDFPQPGVSFKDITPIFVDPAAFRYAVAELARAFREERIDMVVGIESRGFLIGAPLAYELGTGFVVVRKEGKLPRDTLHVDYELEYGTNRLEIHRDALQPGQRVAHRGRLAGYRGHRGRDGAARAAAGRRHRRLRIFGGAGLPPRAPAAGRLSRKSGLPRSLFVTRARLSAPCREGAGRAAKPAAEWVVIHPYIEFSA